MPNLSHKLKLGYAPGRRTGKPNLLTTSIRQGLLAVWHRCEGEDGMVKWVERSDAHRSQFYAMLCKLLPAELAESGAGQGILVRIDRSTVLVQPIPSEKPLASLPAGEQGGACSAGQGATKGNPTGTDTAAARQDVGPAGQDGDA